MDRVVVNLLGPWQVEVGGTAVHVPAGRLRSLLTSLALSAGEPVGVDALAEHVWPEQLPKRVRATLHTYVGRLRTLLGSEPIRTHPGGGHVLDVDREAVDVHRFRVLVEQSEGIAPPEERALLGKALALWRGRPFADLYSTWLDRDVLPRLVEEWFGATERRLDLELAAGRPERVIAELRDLTGRFPTSEALWRRLITALHQAGRRAEALGTYRQVRTPLSDELGLDPGEQLVALQRAILEEGVPPPEALERPHQLPHTVKNVTGRKEELTRLDTLLPDLRQPTPTIVTIDGAPGVGKSTVAVHWAHQVAARCSNAQLYLDLRGYAPERPIPAPESAQTLLRALGADKIPPRPEDRFAALRTALAAHQPLLLLDNARDADQVRPPTARQGGVGDSDEPQPATQPVGERRRSPRDAGEAPAPPVGSTADDSDRQGDGG